MKQEIVYPSINSLFDCNEIEYGIKRTSQVDTIKHHLKSNQVVYVNAPNNIGKTTILKQLFEEYKYDSITLFIKNAESGFISDIEIYKDLFIQIRTLIGEDTSEYINKEISRTELEKQLKTLSYFIKHNNRKVYFIIDGIYTFNKSENNFLSNLFLIFPTNENYKYIISRNKSNEQYGITSKKYENYSLDIFSFEEVKNILSNIADEDIEKIRELFGFSPEIISSIKSSIEQGVELDDILTNSNDNIESLYESEWERVIKSDLDKNILGIVIYSVDKIQIIELCQILDITSIELTTKIKNISLLKVENDLINIRSNGVLEFCKRKLNDNKKTYINMIIKSVGSNIKKLNSSKTVYCLSEQNEYEKVLKIVNEQHIGNTFKETKSLNEINKLINYGIKSSEYLGADEYFIKYKHLKNSLSNIYKSDLMMQQLKCHIEANEINLALTLISKAKSEEEMLQLYCIFAMRQKRDGVEVNDDILNKIEYLFEKIDPNELGPEKVIDIAADLLPIFPDKALGLINKLDSFGVAGQNKSDFAFLNLSLLTLQRHGDTFTTDVNKEDSKTISRTSIIETIKNFNKNSTPENLINFINNFDESGDRIFLYRAWLKNNKKSNFATLILSQTLDEIIKSIDFSIDASLFNDITECLNFSSDNICQLIIEKVKPQLNTLKKKGPSVDFCTLNLNLINHEKNDKNKVEQLDILVSYINSIPDKAVSLTCLSHIANFEIKKNIYNSLIKVDNDKNSLFEKIVITDALHIEVLKECIKVEGQYNLNNAISWSEKLNNTLRRDKAKSIAISSYLKNIDSDEKLRSINDLISIIKSIKEEDYREEIFYLILDKYHFFSPSKNNTEKLIKLIKKIQNNYIKARCFITLYCKAFKLKVLKDPLIFIQNIHKAIANSDGNDIKAELYFCACEKLFKINRDTALEFRKCAIEIVEEKGYSNEGQVNCKINTIELIIRCIYIKCLKSDEDKDCFSDIINEIHNIDSDIKKSKLLSRLASAYQKTGRENFSRKVIEKHIIPLLERNQEINGKEFLLSLFLTLPVIHNYDPDTFNYWLSLIPKNNNIFSDRAIRITINYIYDDCLIGDPYDPLKNKYTIGHRELIRILKLIKNIREDGSQFYEIRRLLQAIKSLRKKNKISKVQEDDLHSNILIECLPIFPKEKFIAHNGYKILLQCEIKSINETLIDETWQELIFECYKIDNISDRSFVLSEVSNKLPERLHLERQKLFEDSISLVDSLSSNIEKANRYKVVCENYKNFDKSIIKEHLKKAFVLCNNRDNINNTTRLEIIDMINSYGESFSSSLVNMLDDDPARKELISKNIKQRKTDEEIKKKFQNNNDISADKKDKELSDLLWQQLGIINSNSGHIPKTFDIKKYTNSIGPADIDDLYKILSYYIHSTYLINPSLKNINEKIKPLFDLFMSNSKILNSLYINDNSDIYKGIDESDCNYTIIAEGERSKAIDFIKKWYQRTDIKYLTIVDPYLRIEDFEFIAEIISNDPEVELKIISSLESKKLLDRDGDLDDLFASFWNENISKMDTPSIDFIFISYGENKKFPIHDRWWLSGSSVIDCGTSINGWGSRASKITILTPDAAADVDSYLSPFVSMNKKYIDDHRIKYQVVKI
ncbi:hypothetical protein EGC79_04095 [Shewanella vesiculosa]|uniref:hypothetical protein n=1 Tax=Shewanella vesiculosa TaxID=518738 RepID=UPI000F4FB756|nr:hypothetical protein [Shewanella vesiculosa]RPA55645.1 hypothetical protein EGC79_04095 [Shewanella vesiculosa]UJL41348.1 hypothetical protein KDH10_002297 [Shewanella vesiculosa]